jgi:hypothetical protein
LIVVTAQVKSWSNGRQKGDIIGHAEALLAQGRLGHLHSWRLAAQPKAILGQVFGGESGSKISIALANPRQNLLLEWGR